MSAIKRFACVCLLALAAPLMAAEVGYGTVGGEILKNPALEGPGAKPGVPRDWIKIISKGGEGVVKLDDGGVLLYFTSTENVDQIRIIQSFPLEKGAIYEFSYEYRSDLDRRLKADATFVGTGVFLRAWWQAPSREWTKVRGLFPMLETAKPREPGAPDSRVTLTMQNRSPVRLWYRNLSLRRTELSEADIERLLPPLRLHSSESDDVFLLPGTRKTHANFIVTGLELADLDRFRFEVDYWPADTERVECEVDGFKVRVPVDKIPGGKSKLIGKMFSRADNALVRTAEVTIERVLALPDDVDLSTPAIVKDPDTGAPFFPILVNTGTGYWPPVSLLKDSGFNLVHTYATERRDLGEGEEGRGLALKYLAAAAAAGVRVLVGVPVPYAYRDAPEIDKLGGWVDFYKNRPEVFGYYLDEIRSIANTPLATVKKAYDTVHRHDGRHGWFAYENPEPEQRGLIDALLIGVNDPNVVKLAILNLGPDVPVIHCYGQRDYMSPTASSLDYNQYNWVMPFIWGARGMYYWTYRNLMDKDINAEYERLKPRVLDCAKRFAPVAPAIVKGDPAPAWAAGVAVDGGMAWKVFADGGAAYVFCGVADSQPAGGTLRFAPPAGAALHDVLNDQPLAAGADGRLTLSLEPGKARIIAVR